MLSNAARFDDIILNDSVLQFRQRDTKQTPARCSYLHCLRSTYNPTPHSECATPRSLRTPPNLPSCSSVPRCQGTRSLQKNCPSHWTWSPRPPLEPAGSAREKERCVRRMTPNRTEKRPTPPTFNRYNFICTFQYLTERYTL